MNIRRIFSLIILVVFAHSCLCACAPKDVALASSHVHTESEHNHEHTQSSGKTQNTSSKKSSDNSDKNVSSKAQVGISRPLASKRDDNVDYDKYTELSDQGINVSTKLFEELDARDNEALYFYNVKGTTYASTSYVSYTLLNGKLDYYKEIRNEQEIRDFKIALSLSTWTPKKFTAKTSPSTVIYFDDDFHLNIEENVDGAFWLSINAPYGKVYYIVPEAVYNYVVEFSR